VNTSVTVPDGWTAKTPSSAGSKFGTSGGPVGLSRTVSREGLGTFGARQLPAVRARELIEEGARQALSDLSAVPPYDPGHPCEIRIEYKVTAIPRRLARRAHVELVDPGTIVSLADD
jgi:D-aminopeptidase